MRFGELIIQNKTNKTGLNKDEEITSALEFYNKSGNKDQTN